MQLNHTLRFFFIQLALLMNYRNAPFKHIQHLYIASQAPVIDQIGFRRDGAGIYGYIFCLCPVHPQHIMPAVDGAGKTAAGCHTFLPPSSQNLSFYRYPTGSRHLMDRFPLALGIKSNHPRLSLPRDSLFRISALVITRLWLEI